MLQLDKYKVPELRIDRSCAYPLSLSRKQRDCTAMSLGGGSRGSGGSLICCAQEPASREVMAVTLGMLHHPLHHPTQLATHIGKDQKCANNWPVKYKSKRTILLPQQLRPVQSVIKLPGCVAGTFMSSCPVVEGRPVHAPCLHCASRCTCLLL